MAQKSFLAPDTEQIRHQLRGILESYSHDWDILAELSQNAVDAIVRKCPAKGHVTVSVDTAKRSIEISDNGVGIDPAQLTKLLRPFGTDKLSAENQIGKKGVGLTFVLFSTSSFEIETHSDSGSVIARVQGARAWIDADTDDEIFIDEGEVEAKPYGTRIKLTLADESSALLQLSFSELVFALRTKTALGNTSHIWGDPLNCDVTLKFRGLDGAQSEKEFECDYLLPTEGLEENVITAQEFIDWRHEKDRSDAEKRVKLKDKIIVNTGKKNQAGRSLKFWCCLVPNRGAWKAISESHGLKVPDQAEDPEEDYFEGFRFGPGLHTSSKGMPTGILLELKPRGSAGYFPNYFIIIEDPSLSFDIGRKSIQGRQQKMLREIAYEQFRNYINNFIKYISGNIDHEPDYDRDEVLAEINSIADLDSEFSTFLKRPNSQEATVAAMFFEQLGKGRYAEFRPLISGYRGRYDLWGKIGNKYNIVEFKFDLSGLLNDVTDETKMFDELNTVVLWDLTEKDRSRVANRGLTLSEIGSNLLSTAQSKFPGAHYKLNMDGVRSIEILCMRKVLKPNE